MGVETGREGNPGEAPRSSVEGYSMCNCGRGARWILRRVSNDRNGGGQCDEGEG